MEKTGIARRFQASRIKSASQLPQEIYDRVLSRHTHTLPESSFLCFWGERKDQKKIIMSAIQIRPNLGLANLGLGKFAVPSKK